MPTRKARVRQYIRHHGMQYMRFLRTDDLSRDLQDGTLYSRRVRMNNNRPVLVGGGPREDRSDTLYLYANLSTEELALLELAWDRPMPDHVRAHLHPLAAKCAAALKREQGAPLVRHMLPHTRT